MLRRNIGYLVSVFLLVSCGGNGEIGSDKFELCDPLAPEERSISIDFAADEGRWLDVVQPVQRCGSSEDECLTYPFPYSLPPVDQVDAESGSWKAGDYDFSFVRTYTRDTSVIVSVYSGPRLYNFFLNEDLSLLAMAFTEDNEIEYWEVCGGELDPKDLRKLAAAGK